MLVHKLQTVQLWEIVGDYHYMCNMYLNVLNIG